MRAGDERGQILGIAGIRHLVQHTAKARHMVVECRIRPVRFHHRVAGDHKQPHQIAQKAVDPFSHHHVVQRHAEMRGQRRAQIMACRVEPDRVCRRAKSSEGKP